MESEKNLMLPLSDDDVKQREEKVPAITRKGVHAAVSYMVSSG